MLHIPIGALAAEWFSWFELAKFDRSIYIPDADNSGTIDQANGMPFSLMV